MIIRERIVPAPGAACELRFPAHHDVFVGAVKVVARGAEPTEVVRPGIDLFLGYALGGIVGPDEFNQPVAVGVLVPRTKSAGRAPVKEC